MPYNAYKPLRRIRADFDSSIAVTPRRRRSDREPALKLTLQETELRHGTEARLILYFAAVLVCTALGVGMEEMRMVGAAWSLFIVGAAFLLAAVRTLFAVPRPSNSDRHRPRRR
jgi:hypothetical protein